MNERLKMIADQYEHLVNNGSLKFEMVDKSTLAPSTVLYIETMLDRMQIRYQVCNIRLDDTVLFKLDHPTVHYLHHDPVTDQHMWADEGFHAGIDGHRAVALLAEHRNILLPTSYLLEMFGIMDHG